MTKAWIHSRNALPSPSSWKYVASLRKSTVMVRFSRVWRAVLRMVTPLVSGLGSCGDTMGETRCNLKTVMKGSGGYHKKRSCTHLLRIIPSAQKPGKMPHLTTLWRGQGHGLASFLLPTRSVGDRMALRHVASP